MLWFLDIDLLRNGLPTSPGLMMGSMRPKAMGFAPNAIWWGKIALTPDAIAATRATRLIKGISCIVYVFVYILFIGRKIKEKREGKRNQQFNGVLSPQKKNR